MSVFRRQHNSNFTTLSNKLLDDERLAADEVGILAYLISRPKDWEVRRPALMRRWGIGIVAMKRIVNAWMRTGWCQAAKIRLPNGQFYIEYRIYDLPGREMSDDEIREALSLVSSEVLTDGSPSISANERPSAADEPPPCQPVVDGQPVAADDWPIKDIQNKDLPSTDSTQKPEREGARAREKHALNLVEFKRRWPTNASDDQRRVDNAWFGLSNEDGEAALAGIAPFLENLKRNHRKHPPAGFTYLEQKRWTLLEAQKAAGVSAPASFASDSVEAKAIKVLHDFVGRSEAFWKIWRRADGIVSFSRPMTPQLAALASVPASDQWVALTRQQAAAWEAFLRALFDDGLTRHRMREGSQAPWPWPPRKDGTLSPTSDNPEMTNDDFDTLAGEGNR